MDLIPKYNFNIHKSKGERISSYELGHTKFIAFRVSATRINGAEHVTIGTSYRRTGRGPWMSTKRELSIPLEYWNELPKYLDKLNADFKGIIIKS